MKVILITGASSGIGAAFARRLAAEKHNLLLVARSADKLRQLCSELQGNHGITAEYITADLTKPDAGQYIVNEADKRGLEVDWLINNAGIGSTGNFADRDLQSELDMINLNIFALVTLTHLYLQKMRARKSGTIINVASMASFMPAPYMAAYAASKAFVRSFTDAVSAENKAYNVRIMLLVPGLTETNFFDAAKINNEEKADMMMMGIQKPEDVVETAMRGLKKGKLEAISGWKNRLSVKLGALIPTTMAVNIMANMMKKK